MSPVLIVMLLTDRSGKHYLQVENNFCHFLLGDPGVGVGDGKISPELVFKLEVQRPIVQNSHPTDIKDTSHNTIHTQIANTNSQTPNT